MVTIEHDFDATVVTLVDDGPALPLREDVVVTLFEDCVTVEHTTHAGRVMKSLSMAQVNELAAALNLPEHLQLAPKGRR
jgi:hypothetical protein